MCGITGIIALSENGCHKISKIQKSVRSLEKRGPDDEGIFVNEQIGLAQRRLSIIDTSAAANQPMWDHTRRYVIVYNGEIFNFKNLKETFFTITEKDYFRTSSDTEVLLYLFIKKGKDCLPLLEGFFAFAVYDIVAKTLFLARDRFGKKPLFLYKDDDCFLFASELKAILEFDIPREIDFDVLPLYLQFGYIPQPLSILKNVRKLEAGSLLEYKEGSFSENKWYHLNITSGVNNLSYDKAKEKLVTLTDAAVEKRMISDVPLGAFLSGGIDSSIITALASRHTKLLNTFSVGFKEEGFFDETKYAALVAKKYNTNHIVFSLGTDDYLQHIFNMLDYMDEPFADTSCLPQYILCKETRKLATVALSGDGGDEVFAGYNKHYAEWQARKNGLSSRTVKMLHPLWKTLPRTRYGKFSNLIRQLDRYATAASLSAKERYLLWASTYDDGYVNKLIAGGIGKKINRNFAESKKNEMVGVINDGDFNTVLKTDMQVVLAGDMLVKVDMMSMANSVEVRSPLLDHNVVDFAFSLPASYKIDKSGTKKILRDAFRHLLPQEIYDRGKKGFEIPMLEWFRNELHTFIFDELLNEEFIKQQGIFNWETVSELKKKLFLPASESIVEQLWILITFQYWYKKYFL